jgi:C4-dicarboxylate transporter DctQ subunit
MEQHHKKSFVDLIEETIIALLLSAMTIITFANVVVRKGFNGNILWANEATVHLFAWLVLLGTAYAIKHNAHLGVDALIAVLSKPVRRILALIAVAACIVFAFLLLKGAWDYWANFANLPATEGRWFPLGFEDKFREKGWYEVQDIPMPDWLRFIEAKMNAGEEYEKIPRFIPYAVLPLSMALLLFRLIVVALRIFRGEQDLLVASHEVEDQIDEAAQRLEEGN